MEKLQKKGAKSNVVRLDLVRIERDRSRKCSCENPIYKVDVTNDSVECERCGASVEAINALKDVGTRFEEMNEIQDAMIDRQEKLEKLEKRMKPFIWVLKIFGKGIE